MDRRAFLSSVVAASMPPAAEPIRIAFLGATHSHAAEKIKVVRENAGYDLVGICDDDPRVLPDGVKKLSRDQLLNDASIRVIAVESGVKQHAAHAKLALEAGKHLHLEKPPSDNLAEFRALVELTRRKKLLMQMGYMWRFHPGINAALEAARKGELGDVWMVRGTMNTFIAADRRPEWALFRGGQMFEQGCHLIDPLVRLLGKPARITSMLRKSGRFDDHMADNTVAVFEYPSALGVIMTSTLQQNGNRHRAFEIFGSKGNAVVRPIEPPQLEMDLPGKPPVTKYPYRRYVGEFAELADCVRSGKPLSVTPEEDLLVHEALLAASQM